MTSQLDGADSGTYLEQSILGVHIFEPPHMETEVKSPTPDAESAQCALRRDEAWRHERVATAAYYLAANRSFEPGHEDEDWSLAELQTDAIDAGRKS